MITKLSNRIKDFRSKNDLTQTELAFQIGVTRKTINTIENGRFIPSVILAIKIAQFFGVKVDDMFSIYEE